MPWVAHAVLVHTHHLGWLWVLYRAWLFIRFHDALAAVLLAVSITLLILRRRSRRA